MKQEMSLHFKTQYTYELRKKYEEKYIGYLRKRYGLKRVNQFIKIT